MSDARYFTIDTEDGIRPVRLEPDEAACDCENPVTDSDLVEVHLFCRNTQSPTPTASDWRDFIREVVADLPDEVAAALPMEDDDLPVIDALYESAALMPVYLLDHSGITVSTTPFNDPWDSGLAGWAWVREDEVRSCAEMKGGYPEYRGEALRCLRTYIEDAVDTYDSWLAGDIWQITPLDDEGDTIHGLITEEVAISEIEYCFGDKTSTGTLVEVTEDEARSVLEPDSDDPERVHGFVWPCFTDGSPVALGASFTRELALCRVGSVTLLADGSSEVRDTDQDVSVVLAPGERLCH